MSEVKSDLAVLAAEFAKAKDDVLGVGVELKGRLDAGDKRLDGFKEQTDDALMKLADVQQRVADLEQKSVRAGAAAEDATMDLGALLAKSGDLAEFAQSNIVGKSVRVSTKATMNSLTTDEPGSAGALVFPHRLGGILSPVDRPLTIRDLLASGSTHSNAISYVRETGFNNAAGFVAEGQALAYSDLKFDEVSVNVKNVGHLMKASRNILADAAQLRSYINGRLVYGLKEVEDRQLLNGDGSGNNLKGILPQAAEFADKAEMANYSIIDQLRLVMLQAVLAGYPASGIVLNPVDWAKLELQKDEIGRHIIGNPQSLAQPRLWGLPVVETTALQAGSFLVGAFNMAAQVFDREEISLEVATENTDDFEKNLVTFKCYERLALAVYRPEAFIKGTLAAKA